MAEKKTKLPKFRSDREEREYWSKHSFEEFASDLEELDVVIRPARTEQIAIRLYKDDLEALQQLAEARGVGHTTLARSVIEDWLGKVRKKVEGSGGKPRRHAS